MNAAAGRWAAVLGHELRNPLAAAMTGAAVLCELLDQDDPRTEVAQGVLRDLQRLSRLTDCYLDFARAGRVAREALDLHQVCAAVAARRAGVVRLLGRPGARIRGSGQLLERTIDNLIDNAVQAGARTVTLVLDAGASGVELSIEDDGPGIPAALLPTLFEPGFSGRGSTGLGLSIVAEVIGAHGGSVACEPLVHGTRFRLRLPAGERAAAEAVCA